MLKVRADDNVSKLGQMAMLQSYGRWQCYKVRADDNVTKLGQMAMLQS